MLPEPIEKVIKELSKLPTIGRKTAQRLTIFLLRQKTSDLQELGHAITNLHDEISLCKRCFNFATDELCQICQSNNRDKSQVCVVEDVLDILALEDSGEYRGLYHVLHGKLSPLDGVGPDDLKIAELISRLAVNLPGDEIEEVILATSTSMEGEATAVYLRDKLQNFDVEISRISQGMPVGGNFDFADSLTIKHALGGRRKL